MIIMNPKFRTGLLIVLSLALFSPVRMIGEAQGSEDYTFRNTRWGMTMDEVIKREGEPDYHPEDEVYLGPENFLGYDGVKFGGLSAYLGYSFAEGKLVGGMYDFWKKYEDENKYIENFEKIRKFLTERYGRPEFEKEIWNRDRYKDEPRKYGAAVASGDLEYYVKWEKAKTEILMVLLSEDGEIDHTVSYYSKEFRARQEENSEE